MFLLLAILMVIQPRRARQASVMLTVSAGLLMVSVFAANGSDAVGAGRWPLYPRPWAPLDAARWPAGAGLGLVLGGMVLGAILGFALGPILYVAVSAVLSGITVAMLGAFAVFESTTLLQATSLVNTKNSILCASVLFSTMGTGFALPALVRMAFNVDRPLFTFLHGRMRSLALWLIMAVLVLAFWIIVVASNTDTSTGAWFLVLIGVVSFAAAFLFSGSAAEGTHKAMLATANALLVVSASFTVSTASSTLSFYLILPLIVGATLAVMQAHEWTQMDTGSSGGEGDNAETGGAEGAEQQGGHEEQSPSLSERVMNLPAPQRIAALALLLAVILFIMFTVDSRFHPAVFDAIIGVGVGIVLSRCVHSCMMHCALLYMHALHACGYTRKSLHHSMPVVVSTYTCPHTHPSLTLSLSLPPFPSGVTLSSGGQHVLLVFTHGVFSFLALFGLSQVTTSSPSTSSQRIGATVAFFGFAALFGALIAIFKLFVPRLNLVRNRFTLHVVESERGLVAIPCDASGTPMQDLDAVQSTPSTGPSGDGATAEEDAQKQQAAGATHETASPFYAPPPSDPAPGASGNYPLVSSTGADAPTTDV